MELNLKIEKKYNMYIVSFIGLPGCWACGNSIHEAIETAYDTLQEWKVAAFHSGFECFQACLMGVF